MYGEDSPEAFGRWLRQLRGKTKQETLAKRLGVVQSVVSRAEQGKLTPETARRYDVHFTGLGAVDRGAIVARHRDLGGARGRTAAEEEESRHAVPPPGAAPGLVLSPEGLAAMVGAGGGLAVSPPAEMLAGLPGGLYWMPTSTGKVVDVSMDRRMFVAGGGLLLPAAALEQTRHDLRRSVTGACATADVGEWQEIAWDYGLIFGGTPPAVLLGRLQVDIAALGEALQRLHADLARRELHRVAALLAAFTALTVADLGDLHSARRWWRTAKQAADVSGDVQARLWVRGQEVVSALYEQRPVPVILDLVAEAEAVSADAKAPPAAIQGLLDGKARTLALASRNADAETALHEVRENFGCLPALTTGDAESYFGWPESRLRMTESYAYSHLGDYASAERAQTAALALFPAAALLGPAKIKLHRALCLVRTGDTAAGVEHAHEVMTGLPRERHDHFIADLGHRVLDAVPVAERGRDGVREFREYVGGHGVA